MFKIFLLMLVSSALICESRSIGEDPGSLLGGDKLVNLDVIKRDDPVTTTSSRDDDAPDNETSKDHTKTDVIEAYDSMGDKIIIAQKLTEGEDGSEQPEQYEMDVIVTKLGKGMLDKQPYNDWETIRKSSGERSKDTVSKTMRKRPRGMDKRPQGNDCGCDDDKDDDNLKEYAGKRLIDSLLGGGQPGGGEPGGGGPGGGNPLGR